MPAEALIDLARQLSALPARSHERRLAVAEAARGYGVSEPTVYRALAERSRPKGLRRADHGTPRVLPADRMERYCELIAAIKMRTSNRKGRHLSTAETIRLLENFGIETPDGLVRAEPGMLCKTTVNRYLRQWGYDRATLGRAPPAVHFQAEHSNDCWQFDLSPSDLKHVEAPSWVRDDQKPPTLMLFSVVDDCSGVAYQEYRCVYGEEVGAALRFLFNAMSDRECADLPLRGMPRMLYMDNGPVARSQVFQRVMRYLGMEIRTHLPVGHDARRQYRARATGKVERPFRTVKELHETLYHFQKPRDENEANAWLHNFLIRYNAMDHRSGEHSRAEHWLQHLPADGIRAICNWERFCTFAREPEQRKVAADARITVGGIEYEVDLDLAGEDVVLWWGLFDQELFVEHGRKRYGPYLPVGGPIPLNRYRAFRKTAVQARGERIEALAATLGLPRAALESRPDVAALVVPDTMPVQAFVDPDPFQQLTYASALEAKRAIAQYLGRPLATLPVDQLQAINVIVGTTLNKQDVLARVCACVTQPSEELPNAE
ncbi:DDE-type integrase/transposase/recombinase [Ralstonia solanacearum]|uniref:DDE-type integrase/transposase/recombinase n=1 Tax=Ralstonia solanacearum TaxID=305 RepID=UPI0009BD19E8|nr:DDE-type integrase/transposase/recombinase [Ralstonia solanacearum]MDB0542809.1 DDE-type integrase/transposase/recombinase [Ralstonia solanacearum]MDB0553054.1 DDE-type integrase/transposase/recombinase [Ralstonia solanacearum]MDB0557815.1 DDE-type integrase/transposase/recombinase [Ralstonia solanacearum]